MRPIYLLVLLLSTNLLYAEDAKSPSAAEPVADQVAKKASGAAKSALYDEAIRLEAGLQLSRAASLYEELAKQCDPTSEWEMVKKARHGLRRVKTIRRHLALDEAELHKRLADTFRDYRPSELAEWEKRGWVEFRYIDGRKVYGTMNPTNLAYCDVTLRRRNPNLTERSKNWAAMFLDSAAGLDKLRAASKVPARYVNPVRYVHTTKATLKQADLAPGKVVRAWIPFPLLRPMTQNIEIVSVRPAGALKYSPDTEGEIGIAYMEIHRPEKEGLTIELVVTFDAYETDFIIDPQAIPPYDEQGWLYRRFTRSESQMKLTPELQKLTSSIVGDEKNPYHKARKLYDWVLDNVKYNYSWWWRDSAFTYGSASEDVRIRRLGDCMVQSEFYAALCRSAGVPARVCGGFIFTPVLAGDHAWNEIFFPKYGWMPVDVTFCQGACLAPDLTEAQIRTLRDYFFGRMDRWRFCTHHNQLGQCLLPVKRSPRRETAIFNGPEFECGGQDVENVKRTRRCKTISEVVLPKAEK